MKSHIRRAFVFLMPFLMSGNCQIQRIEGFVGEEVVLPCAYNGSKDILNVFWRDRGDNNVLDIKDKTQSLASQNKKYSGRVSSFPQEYGKKNYSIVMKTLYLNDSNVYKCFIHTADEYKIVNLTVSARPTTGPTPPSKGGATRMYHLHLLAAPILTGLALKSI